MVKAPSAVKAASCLAHSPGSHQQGDDLPMRAMQILNMRKSGEAQAGQERAQGQNEGAHERFLPKAKDGEQGNHGLYKCRGSTSSETRVGVPCLVLFRVATPWGRVDLNAVVSGNSHSGFAAKFVAPGHLPQSFVAGELVIESFRLAIAFYWKSAKVKPSRVTISPASNRTGPANMGPS